MTAALGGVCIEKHYTLDKPLRDVPDHAISVDPAELAEMVRACERGAVLRGDELDRGARRASARRARTRGARSCSSARCAAGHELRAEDLGFKRPGTGIPPFEVDRMVGRRARRDLVEGTVLDESDLE